MVDSQMSPEPNEVYRGIKIYLGLAEDRGGWTGCVAFELGDVDSDRLPPSPIKRTFSRSDQIVPAMAVGDAMLTMARAAIDEWHENGNR